MPDSATGGAVGFTSAASFEKNPDDIELPGAPKYLGTAAKVIRDRDGTTRIQLTSFASYEDRTVSVGEEIDVDTTQIDEMLNDLVAANETRLGRRAIRAAMQAWMVAVRNGDMEA